MTTYAITIGGNGTESRAYEPGHRAQLFMIQPSADGSSHLINPDGLVLATTGDGGVMSSRGAADGSSAISFEVQNHGDGTVRIKAGYYNLWVQLTAYDVKTVQWDPNSPYQRLTQRDGGNGYYSFTVDL
ncbi:hypothetical protein MRBLPD1_001538 [Pseudomonas brassicacearum]|uniref:hypothetical protein n=1 Tax=Pseudomonas brassicacearum TaxID=930166 RepID=UPI0034672C4F